MKVRTRQGSKNQIIATIIETTPEEIEEGTGMATGLEVATIEVAHYDGSITRFFISLRSNKQNRAICEVATNKKDGTTTSRRLTGVKWR